MQPVMNIIAIFATKHGMLFMPSGDAFTMKYLVDRRDRTDEDIERDCRELKVLCGLLTGVYPKVCYKVVSTSEFNSCVLNTVIGCIPIDTDK